MKRLCTILLVLMAGSAVLFGQELAEQELRTVSPGTVEFVNYEGPHERIDTLPQILGIGRALARDLAGGRVSSIDGRYRVERIFDPDAEGLSADIFILGEDSGVDHIRNLRRIVAAYLSEAYGYDFRDAEILAEFASYYNAVHRGEMDYFAGVYQPRVTAALDPEKAGLATVWSEWAGKTQMLLPLRGGAAGGLGPVDTDVLTGDEVIEDLQKDADKGIPERKEMTELRERELAQEEIKIDEERAVIQEEERAIAQEERNLEAARQELDEQRQEAEAIADPGERGRREEVLAAEEEAAKAKEEELESRRQAVEERGAAVAEAEAGVEERVERIRTEREAIAEDERSLIEERSEAPAAEVPFLYLEGGELRRLVSSDSKSGRITRRSGISSIRSRDLVVLGDAWLVIAGEEGGTRAVRLVTIDPESLEMRTQGDTDVYPGSFILVDGRRVYTVIMRDGYRVGRFDASLKLQATSSVEVVPETWLTLKGGALYAQDSNGDLYVLDPDTLTNIAE
jgi:Borrelia P83/100 protein